jgi:MFS transporter, FHS family, glucose/mannose:H+ symporter
LRSAVYIPYVIFAYLSLFTLGLLDNARGPYFPDIASALSLGDSSASFLFVTTSFVSFLMGRWVPLFLNRMSVLNLMRIGHLSMAIGMFSLSWITSFFTMILSAAVFGIGFGIVNVAQNILILDGATPAAKRQLLSGLHSFYALASLFAPLLISMMVGEGIDWRRGLLFFSAVPLLALLYSLFCENQPHTSGVESAALPEKFKKDVLAFALGLGLYVAAEVLVCTRMVLFLNREYGFETQASALYLTLFFVLMLVGRATFTFVKFKNVSNRDIIRYSLILSTIFYGLGMSSPWFLVLTGLFMGPIFGVSIDYSSQIFSYATSRALSRVLSLQALIVVSMHFFIGFITEQFGIKNAMLLGLVFLGFSFLIVQLEPWKKRSS